MPTTRPHLLPTDDDSAFRKAISALAARPSDERKAVVAAIGAWFAQRPAAGYGGYRPLEHPDPECHGD